MLVMDGFNAGDMGSRNSTDSRMRIFHGKCLVTKIKGGLTRRLKDLQETIFLFLTES